MSKESSHEFIAPSGIKFYYNPGDPVVFINKKSMKLGTKDCIVLPIDDLLHFMLEKIHLPMFNKFFKLFKNHNISRQ